jgi:hypothetical protein
MATAPAHQDKAQSTAATHLQNTAQELKASLHVTQDEKLHLHFWSSLLTARNAWCLTGSDLTRRSSSSQLRYCPRL